MAETVNFAKSVTSLQPPSTDPPPTPLESAFPGISKQSAETLYNQARLAVSRPIYSAGDSYSWDHHEAGLATIRANLLDGKRKL